jgi:protein-disulfide isomerase
LTDRTTRPSTTPSAGDGTPLAGRRLGALVLLGAASALWSLYLWTELVRARGGGTPFCAFGESGCALLWDAAFASAVHRFTGLPVAGWGLAWGMVATLLPLAGLVAASEGRGSGRWAAATRMAACGGLAGVLLLLAASAAERLFCSSCALTYVLTGAYFAVALVGPRPELRSDLGRGLLRTTAVTAAAYLLLLYPGLATPGDPLRASERALAAVAPGAPGAAAGTAARAPVADADALLARLVADLPPQARQLLSDSLHLHATSPAVPPQPPRALRGAADAPVRITTFTDVLCSHCATLHETLGQLEALLPPGSFSIDSRQLPLDGNCNAFLPIRGPESVRCVAARAKICLDTSPRAKEFTGALFARQGQLTPALVYEVAAPFVARAELERCVASPETARQLAADIGYAWRFEPDGTPLVLVNGRRGTSFGPFLYAMVLTGGEAAHPAFAALPPPNPHAHLH